ncbi:hypothetical protein D3C72_2166310 [compost metagenome]
MEAFKYPPLAHRAAAQIPLKGIAVTARLFEQCCRARQVLQRQGRQCRHGTRCGQTGLRDKRVLPHQQTPWPTALDGVDTQGFQLGQTEVARQRQPHGQPGIGLTHLLNRLARHGFTPLQRQHQ